jgi:hypothetical protein
MGELLNVRVLSTREIRTIEDVEPSISALRFKELSDKIWAMKPEDNRLSMFGVDIKKPLESRNDLNETLKEIDHELVISGIHRAVLIHASRQEEDLEISPNLLTNPVSGSVGTFNWDWENVWRFADVNGKKQAVEFTDGHRDFFREIYCNFNFYHKDNPMQLSYSIQRIQARQDRNATLTMTLWDGRDAYSGYEGEVLKHSAISMDQEKEIIDRFAFFGGIALS